MSALREVNGIPVVPWTAERDMRLCPKCDGRGQVARTESADSIVRGMGGELFAVGFRCGAMHLVVACDHCGWEWLMEPRDAS